MVSKLHYISQETPDTSHLQSIEAACQAGCDWIQLRVKNCTYEEYEEIARETKEICDRFGAKLIINDNVSIAQKIASHGVHLGKLDMPVEKAREILGNKFVIGGTANTFKDVERLARAGVDYIGLGPFRFTNTKENLSPILGLAGYQQVLHQCQHCDINIPVIAIGGITADDISKLLETGIHGVAISSAITQAENKRELVSKILEKLNHEKITNS